jgi:hypothetical protein
MNIRSASPPSADTNDPEHVSARGQATQAPDSQFLEALRASLQSARFLQVVLGKARKGAILERAEIRLLSIKSQPMLSFRLQQARSEQTKNYPVEQGLARIAKLMPSAFLAATLFTRDEDVVLQYSKKLEPRLYRSKPSSKLAVECEPDATGATAIPEQHNRRKQYLVCEGEPFLYQLGISTQKGQIKPDRGDKFRQINKFIEILQVLEREAALESLPQLHVLDYGSGKNYLTFALYQYFAKSRRAALQVTGVEARPELVQHGNQSAAACGFDKLHFEQGEIAHSRSDPAEIVVALHACDTATDDALLQAIKMQARVIAVAPCCQKYLRPRLKLPAELEPIFKHGIMHERLAESLTNGLRALVLEAYGYHTKVFEFIGGEHTAKNVMISATRRQPQAALRPESLAEIARVKAHFGIADFYLDRVLGIK